MIRTPIDAEPSDTVLVSRGEPIDVPEFDDPCLPSGTTQYGLVPCTPTTTVAEVGTPPTLPATGMSVADGLFGGLAFALVGACLIEASFHWRRRR